MAYSTIISTSKEAKSAKGEVILKQMHLIFDQIGVLLEISPSEESKVKLQGKEEIVQKYLLKNIMKRALNDVMCMRHKLKEPLVIFDMIYAQGYVLYLAKIVCNATSDKLDQFVKALYSDNSLLIEQIVYLSSGILSLPILLKILGDKMIRTNHSELKNGAMNEEEAIQDLLNNSTKPSAVVDFYVSMKLNKLDVDKLMKIYLVKCKSAIFLRVPLKSCR